MRRPWLRESWSAGGRVGSIGKPRRADLEVFWDHCTWTVEDEQRGGGSVEGGGVIIGQRRGGHRRSQRNRRRRWTLLKHAKFREHMTNLDPCLRSLRGTLAQVVGSGLVR